MGIRAAGRDDDDVQKEIEGHKNDLLQKQKEGKGHWKKELASSSEAAVRGPAFDFPLLLLLLLLAGVRPVGRWACGFAGG
jgi:hypothetical protein